MRVALYAPMKPPDDPLPSGDRKAARMLERALAHSGHATVLASRLVTWAAAPEPAADAALAAAAGREVDRLRRAWAGSPDRPSLWLTYHLYHKAPDLLGPAVADALAIPYVVVEASRAAKRTHGPWAARQADADRALARADAVAAVHGEDAEGLAAVVPPGRLHRLPPFLDIAPFAVAAGPPPSDGVPRLLAVGMMRPGGKAASYAVLAAALGRLADRPWRLAIAGDGPARDAVEAAFAAAGLGADRVRFLGRLAEDALPAAYSDADVFVWPAVREAYGFVFLEAQAAGLPVVGADRSGVRAIVRGGETGLLPPEGDAAAFAAALATLLDDAALRRRMGRAAAAHVRRDHGLPAGAARLDALLAAAAAVHAGRPPCAR